jgi:uncharacterized protein (DUF2252 family)
MNGLPTPVKRSKLLQETRERKMARDAHAYVRGNTERYYAWLAAGPKIPVGPSIWICGDCHISNLGPVAAADGSVDVQIRDLDQTVIGNPAHDVIRLALSMASAARSCDLPGVATAKILEEIMRGYEHGLAGKTDYRASKTEVISDVLARSARRRWHHLAEERIKDVTPAIPLGHKFWPLSKEEKNELGKLFEDGHVRRLLTTLRSRESDDPIALLDAAYWVKGCSSLGRSRYAALLSLGKKAKPKNFCLVDLKEATSAAAPRDKSKKMPTDNADRVVAGAKALAPNLGDRMMAVHLLGKSFVLRELLPQDMKIEFNGLDPEEAIAIAGYLASVVGVAHGRQLDRATRQAWVNTLQRQRPKSIDAPTWLWSNVTELLSHHEVAYLEHCRKFARDMAA